MAWKCTNTPKGDNKLYSDAGGFPASLDLRFASDKNLNDFVTNTPLVDHQRSMSGSNLSAGTFVNSSGLVESAKVNLLTYSEDYSQWSTALGGTLTLETSFNPPSGLRTVYKLEGDGTKASAEAPNNVNTQDQYTVTVYANAGTAQYIQIWKSGGVGNLTANFDLINGTSNAVADCATDITPAGNGWYRCQVVSDSSIDQFKPLRINIAESLSAGRNAGYTGSGYVYLSGAQIETGTTASTYIPTTNLLSAAPRFDHDPTTGESLGLLIEENRENLVSNSISLPNTTLSSETAPDGTLTARLWDGTTNSTFYTGFPDTDTIYTVSFYVKTSSTFFVLRSYGIQPSTRLDFRYNFATDSIINFTNENKAGGTGATMTPLLVIKDFPNGWKYIAITGYIRNETGIYFNEFSADTDYNFWGFQIEQGSFPTSYIPTSGSTVTRNADEASITGTNFSSWYNQSEGAIFTDSIYIGNNDFSTGFVSTVGISDGTFNDGDLRVFGYKRSNTDVVVDYQEDDRIRLNSVTLPWKSKNCYTYADVGGTNSWYSDGNLIGSLTRTLGTTSYTTLSIFKDADQSTGHIARLTYFPYRIPDANLQAMTT